MDIQSIDIEKVAKAIELDAGHALPGLRESLGQAKRGEFAAVHTPEMLGRYKAHGQSSGSTKEQAKQAVTVRYKPA